MKLPFPMGTELTAIHIYYNESQYNRLINYVWGGPDQHRYDRMMQMCNEDVEKIIKHLHKSNTLFSKAAPDNHCIEVSSKIIHTYEDYRRFSINVRKAFADNFYAPKNPTAVCGGAHVHVGSIPKKLQYEICRDLVMRPYLPWIFGEPDEDGSMNVLLNCKNSFKEYAYRSAMNDADMNYYYFYIEKFIESLFRPFNNNFDYAYLSSCMGKDYMFRLSREYKTLEFRFMEMTETWEEQELQLHFICNYLKWVLERGYNWSGHLNLLTDEELQAIKPQDCIDLFNELCYDIGLDSDDYKPFIKRNLYPRWEEGRKRV